MSSHPVSIILALFLVINILGNIPVFLTLLKPYPVKKQRLILVREFGMALLILLLFNFFGAKIFDFLGITPAALGMTGGILLLLISISMIFPQAEKQKGPQHDPFLVPLATPLIAGPGSIAAVMLYATQVDDPMMMTWLTTAAIAVSFATVFFASLLKDVLGEKGLVAFEKLGGMILSLIAVQMFAGGAVEFVQKAFNI